jgi:CO dehydrogenase nickel-insertion accessory protein CooC1
VLGQLEFGRGAVIADLEAGLGTLTRLAENTLDQAVLVVNPDQKSIEVARRASELIVERNVASNVLVIANRLRGEEDLELIRTAMSGAELAAVPEDPYVSRAEFEGQSVVDIAPASPAVQALATLAQRWDVPPQIG